MSNELPRDDSTVWAELVRAGQVPDPDESILTTARGRLNAPTGKGPLDGREGRRLWIVGAGIAASLALFGGSALVVANADRDQAPLAAHDAPSKTKTPSTSTSSAAPKIPRGQGGGPSALSAIFAVPSLQAFAGTKYVENVVTGVVTDVSPEIPLGTTGESAIQMTVRVTQSRSALASNASEIQIWQTSGLDTVARAVPVGSNVLVLVGEASQRGHLIRALLVDSGDGSGYRWTGTQPNPAWASVITNDDAGELLDTGSG